MECEVEEYMEYDEGREMECTGLGKIQRYLQANDISCLSTNRYKIPPRFYSM